VGRERGPHDRRALVVWHEAVPQVRWLVIRLTVSLRMLLCSPERAAESARHGERRGVYHAGINADIDPNCSGFPAKSVAHPYCHVAFSEFPDLLTPQMRATSVFSNQLCRHALVLCSLGAMGFTTHVLAASPRWTGICSRCDHFWVQWVEPAAPKTACEKIKNGS